jgi:hypothetical protein
MRLRDWRWLEDRSLVGQQISLTSNRKPASFRIADQPLIIVSQHRIQKALRWIIEECTAPHAKDLPFVRC